MAMYGKNIEIAVFITNTVLKFRNFIGLKNYSHYSISARTTI